MALIELGATGTKSGLLAAQGERLGDETDNEQTQMLLELLKMNQQQTTTGTTTTNPVFANPEQSSRLIDLVTNAVESGTKNIADLGNFTSSKTFQDSLAGLLGGAFQKQTQQGYSDLADAARIAGGSSGMRSGAYATSLGRYAGDRSGVAGEMAAKLVGELLPSYVAGNTAALSQAAPLLNAQKGEQTVSTQTSESKNPMSPKISPLQKQKLQWLGM